MELQKFLRLLKEDASKSEYFKKPNDDEKRKYLLSILSDARNLKNAYSLSKMSKKVFDRAIEHCNLEKELEEFKQKTKLKNIQILKDAHKGGECPYCGKECEDLLNHINLTHRCKYCSPFTYYDNFNKLKQHVEIVHPEKFEEFTKTCNNLVAKQAQNKEQGLKQPNQFTKWGNLEIPIYLKQNPNIENITELELRKLVNSGKYNPTYKMPHGSLYQQFGPLNPFFGKTHKEESIAAIKGTIEKLKAKGMWHSWVGGKNSDRRSYPEQYFFDFFEENLNNLKPINNRHAIGYWMDFAWEDGKFYIEIDGEQHYTPEGQKHDKIREGKLLKEGWRCIERVRWSEYQKKSVEEKKAYLEKILNKIKGYGVDKVTPEKLEQGKLVETGEETFEKIK